MTEEQSLLTSPTYYFILLIIYALLVPAYLKFFEKHGVEKWKAYVPIINLNEHLTIIGRPKTWIIWSLIPVVNILIFIGLLVDTFKCYAKFRWQEHVVLVITFPYSFFKIVSDDKSKFLGKITEIKIEKPVKSKLRPTQFLHLQWKDLY